MLDEIKSASKHSLIYGLGNLAPKIIGLILIPLYTNPRYLSQADYGALAVLEATTQLLVGILTMAMIQGLTRWYWEEKYLAEQKSLFFTTFVFLLVTILPLSVALLLFSEPLSQVLFKSSSFSYLIQLSIITAGLKILNNQIFCLAKLQSKSVLYSLTSVAKFVLILGFTLYWIILKGKGLEAIWQAYVIGEGIILIALIPYAYVNSKLKFQIVILKEMLVYGLPLMFATVSGVILAVTDRYMLNSMTGLEQTGTYSLGLRIANTLNLVLSTSFALALSPIRMKKINDPDNKRFYSKINTYTAFVFILALLVLSLFSLEFLKVFTGSAKYWAANGVIPILSFALFFGLLRNNVTIGLVVKKKTRSIGIITFITGVLNVGLNLVLIRLLDIYGAALATLLSQLFFFTTIYIVAQKAYSIPYELKKIIILILVSTLFIIGGVLLADLNVWIRLPVKFGFLVLFPLILFVLNFYEKKEVEIIKLVLKTWYNPKKLGQNIKRFLN